jgi:hypothetical protein
MFTFRKNPKKQRREQQMSKMYKTLLQLKKIYKREAWLKMVEQAKEKNRITEEEYKKLTEEES